MDVAIDKKSIVIAIESPLDNLLGFERAPRTESEKKLVAEVLAKLNRADTLLIPDPAAFCTLQNVEIRSEALALDTPSSMATTAKDEHGQHADLYATVTYSCKKPELARFIDQKLFDNFKNIRTVNAQIATSQGQFKRTLKTGNTRLNWGR